MEYQGMVERMAFDKPKSELAKKEVQQEVEVNGRIR